MLKEKAIDLKYPIGAFVFDKESVKNSVKKYIQEIEETPLLLKKAVKGLTEEQLNTPYRKNGWTVRQVVHHLPDSHINAYVRFKLTLTENKPSIKTYDEKKWANLIDSSQTPISVSLDLLDSLHKRWVILLKGLTPSDLKKTFVHPEWGNVTLYFSLAQYAWHGKHHVAHITSLRKRMAWK